MNPKALQWTDDPSRVGFRPSGEVSLGILCVGNPQTTAGIDVANVVSVVPQGANQESHACHGLAERSDVNDLRADMDTDAGGLQAAGRRYLAIELGRFAHGHSEFMLMQAGRDVGVSFGVNVGIVPDGEMSGLAEMCGTRAEHLKLAGALDVEQQNTGAQGEIDFVRQLADSGEDDAR